MPSNLPVIKANTKQINIDKMKYIAKTNKRSLARELEMIVENYIKEYETQHGPIKVNRGGVKIYKIFLTYHRIGGIIKKNRQGD